MSSHLTAATTDIPAAAYTLAATGAWKALTRNEQRLPTVEIPRAQQDDEIELAISQLANNIDGTTLEVLTESPERLS